MDDKMMTDETLFQLKTLHAEAASPEARKLALNAAMVAFDAAQAARPQAAMAAGQGWFGRLARQWKWSAAGLGAGLGTAAAAIVLVPLSMQTMTATSSRLDGVTPPKETITVASNAPATPVAADQLAERKVTTVPVPVAKSEARLAVEGTVSTVEPLRAEPVSSLGRVAQSQDLGRDAAKVAAAPMTEAAPLADEGEADLMAMPAPAANATAAGGMGYRAVPTVPSGDSFQKFDENRVKVTANEPVSTFSIDVDTASYSYVRGLLEDGYLPEPDAVRLEELINYFPYDYPASDNLDAPFKPTMAIIPTPWNPKTELLEIGIKGYVPPATERQPENLTFLIDTSGSMDEPNKLPLLKRAFGLLVDTLKPTDTVSIVVYAGSAGVVLKPTRASERTAILAALDHLEAGGSTAGAEGIELAYRMAGESKIADGVNRVILATDGDFNVGIDTPDALKTFIKSKRDEGIFLSVLGFGRGNLDDALMQALAQNGNGNASYIDSFKEAQKVLVAEGGANMVTIAKDVKIQVEFNPAQVSEYRLIGYETRALNREDFNNDTVDAGEIGAGHTVTAIYEITPTGSGGELNDPLRYGNSAAPAATSDELGFLKLRYKAPNGDVSKLMSTPIGKSLAVGDIAQAGTDQRFAAAVAAFGQKLKGSAYGEALSWDAIATLANGAKGADEDGYRAEFVQMVHLAASLAPDRPDADPGLPPSVE